MSACHDQPIPAPARTAAGRVVWINGRYVPEAEAGISVFDSAAMFGDLVFEMTRSFNRRQFKLREHVDRLYRSARSLRIPAPTSAEALEALVEEVADRNRPCMDQDDEDRVMINLSRGILSLYHPIFGGDPGPTLIVSSFPLSLTLSAFAGIYDQGIHAVVPSQRAIPADLLDPKIKNRSRLHYMTANIQVSQIPDPMAWALLLDPDGFVAEGTGANFFIVFDGELWTPEPRNILCGITRAHTMELARRIGMKVRETNFGLYHVINAQEAFYTSTPACIYPCTKIDGVAIGDGRMGDVTQRLLRAWSDDVGVDIVEQTRRYVERTRASVGAGATPYRFNSTPEKAITAAR